MSETNTGSEPWKIQVTGPALKTFRRLPEKAASAIVEFMTGALAGNPHRLSKPLTNELLGMRTARRGDYRVLFTLDVEEHVLYIHRIQHRADVYKTR